MVGSGKGPLLSWTGVLALFEWLDVPGFYGRDRLMCSSAKGNMGAARRGRLFLTLRDQLISMSLLTWVSCSFFSAGRSAILTFHPSLGFLQPQSLVRFQDLLIVKWL